MKMEIKFALLITSIYIFSYSAEAMDMVLDFKRAKTDDYMVVKRRILKHGTTQVVCTARKKIHKFTIIKGSGIRVPIDDDLRASEASFYARDSIKLIKILNPRYWLLNRRGGRYLYFKLDNREWVQIRRREFTYYYRAITTITTPLDLDKSNIYVETITMNDGRVAYVPKSAEIFIYKISRNGRNIWPDKDEMQNQFSLGIYTRKKGVETFNIRYKDDKNRMKWTYRKLVNGKWVKKPRWKSKTTFSRPPKFTIAQV